MQRGGSLLSAVMSGDLNEIRREAAAKPGDINKALVLAAGQDKLDVLNLLLGLGANANGVDGEENSPLVSAAIGKGSGGNIYIIKALLDAGANPNVAIEKHFQTSATAPVNSYTFSKTPQYWAASKHRVDILRYLIMRGAKIPVLDDSTKRMLIDKAVPYRTDAETAALRQELRNLLQPTPLRGPAVLPPPVIGPVPQERVSVQQRPPDWRPVTIREPALPPIIQTIPADIVQDAPPAPRRILRRRADLRIPDIPMGSESVLLDDIAEGTPMVDFANHYSRGQYFTRQEWDGLPTGPDGRRSDPLTRELIRQQDITPYIAHIVDDVEPEGGKKKTRRRYKFPRKYSKSYCRRTTCKKMGFTQRSSCRPYKNCFKASRSRT